MAVILVKIQHYCPSCVTKPMQGLVLHKLCYNEKSLIIDMPMHDTNMIRLIYQLKNLPPSSQVFSQSDLPE